MADYQRDCNKEIGRDEQGAAAVDNDSEMAIDAAVENKESILSEETAKVVNEESPHLEGAAVAKQESPRYEGDQNPTEIALAQANVEDLQLPNDAEGPLPGEKVLAEPPSVVATDTTADANTITNGLHASGGKSDVTNLDPQDQPKSVVPNEGSLEAKPASEKVEESNNGKTGMHSPVENGTNNEKSNNGVTVMELPSKNETEEERMDDGVTRMELPPESENEEELNNEMTGIDQLPSDEVKEELPKPLFYAGDEVDVKTPRKSFLLEPDAVGINESGTEEEQAAFIKELETFHREQFLEFKPLKFYGEPLNCLKLWRAVIRLGGYEQVTSCKLWRQVGESFKPPKTCTTVSWTFRCFYEKALLEYEKHKMRCGELPFTDASFTEPASAGNQVGLSQGSGSGRARRDAAARAMQGWHSQRLLGNGEVGDPIIKDKNSTAMPKREKQLKSIDLLRRKRPSSVENAVKVARMKASKPQVDTMIVDVGPPADWVKVNVQRTKDCFEVYALVPGLLREEVRVQSDPAGRLVISGQPEQLDNHWGVTPFKKVVSLPSRIDPHQTSAVVTLHGQLFVRVPFEQSDL